jgi:serine protease AprX
MDDASSDMQLIAYPNPFENLLNIGFTVPELTDVRVTVSDQYGNILKVLMDQALNPDNYTIQWVCDEEPAGMYIIRLQAGNRFIVQKVVLIR